MQLYEGTICNELLYYIISIVSHGTVLMSELIITRYCKRKLINSVYSARVSILTSCSLMSVHTGS